MYKCLAEFLKTRKGKYVLFLGAGASISSGGRTTQGIIDDIIERYGETKEIIKRIKKNLSMIYKVEKKINKFSLKDVRKLF